MLQTKFGLWTVIAPAEPLMSGRTRKRALSRWLCRCVCGSEREVLEKNLKNGSSTGCRCVTRSGTRWDDNLIAERLQPHIKQLGRMPTSTELVEVEDDHALSSAIAQYGGYAAWTAKLGTSQSGGTTHKGQMWERREFAFFESLGYEVVAQSTQATFDLLVNAHRVDVKSGAWFGPSVGFVFGLRKRDHVARCDYFDLLCIDGDELLHRFVVPSREAQVQTVTITQRQLDGRGKYSKWRDRTDLLA